MQTQRSTSQRKQELDEIYAWLISKVKSYAPIDVLEVDISKSFASYGLSSADAVSLSGELEEWLDRRLSPTLLYNYPTIALLGRALIDEPTQAASLSATLQLEPGAATTRDIAIIGMAGRFPGASNVDEFWQNLRAGLETITVFSPEELIAAGSSAEAVHHPDYVCARPVLKTEEVEYFDAAFFGYSPHEATITDPQHRIFLECAWEAMERAGYAPTSCAGLVGVYAGCSLSTYLLALAAADYIQALDDYQLVIAHDKDSLTSTVSYKLDLKGPSFAVQTFCSTSLVAVHLACQSLLHGECDLALAGGVSVRVPDAIGYRYHEGGMESNDGHCRAFDSKATGTLFGDGAGVVVLKRLQDALRDGDSIDAIIKGSAVNNDGLLKMSYTAPSIVGQSAAIASALALAGVDASTLGYVEAHGSATELGDPIEVAALTRAFRQQTDLRNYCGLGSVKSNIGHLDRAAGIAGLIKVVQALKHKELPATLHIQTPNLKLDLEQSPFFLTTQLRPWTAEKGPRRASINSLGLGGTNAHVVLEEAPELPETSPSRPWQLLMLSACTETALETATRNLWQYLHEHEHISLADVAYTLQVGRKTFEHRRVLLCRDQQDALRLLATPNAPRVIDQVQQHTDNQIFFLFPDVGEQHLSMAQELYEQEAFFRNDVDYCCQILHPLLRLDLRAIFYSDARTRSAVSPIKTELAQPAVFVLEYALARLLIHWGVKPDAMLGYSLGEYVAATLAGVLSLEDALTLVARQAQLIASQPLGAMLSVALSESEIHAYLQQWPQIEVDLAVVAAPQTCVLAGPAAMIEQLRHHLLCDEIACQQVETTHAFHSRMLSPLKKQLTRLVRGMALCPPAIPYISNVTGTWITDEQATSHEYWAEHMCETVRFADGAGCLLQRSSYLFVEVGVGQTLTSFVRQHPSCSEEGMTKFIATQPAQRSEGDYAFLLTSIGRLWLAGVEPDWKSFYAGECRRRIPLPTYPFERQRYWIDVRDWRHASAGRGGEGKAINRGRDKSGPYGERKSDISKWFSIPGWKQAPPLQARARGSDACWLIFVDEVGIGEELARRFAAEGQRVVTVAPGRSFAAVEGMGAKADALKHVATQYRIDPRQPLDYRRLLQELARCQLLPTRILHCWSVTMPEHAPFASVQQDLDAGFYSLLALAQALGEIELGHCVLSVLADGIYDVLGQEQLSPAKATILGPCRVIPQEYEALSCHLVEIAPSDLLSSTTREGLIDLLAQELAIEAGERIVALRGMRRWLPTFEEVQIPEPTTPQSGLRERGVYLLTGGLGGIGLALAEYLASSVHARLVLISREELPPRHTWPELLRSHAENERTRQQIRAIMAMEQHGAEVLVMAADVTDEAQMRQVFERTQATFGTLNGVLHLAGIPGAGLIQLKTRESAAQVLAPKVHGTLVLHRLLQSIPLDFLLLFSSITTVTGGPGQVDYSAANAFLDAYARSCYCSYPVVAIDWSEWQWNAWSDALAGYNEPTRAFFEENRRTYGITFQEGASVLQRLLARPFPQVIVSTQDVQSLVDLSHSFTITTQLPWIRSEPLQTAAHARPPLKNSYIAPRNDDERKMVRIWEAVLAIDGIGIYDNFFDLGGNSLLGVNLLLQVRKAFSLEHLPAYVLYEAPCVEAMTRYLTQDKQTTTQDVLDERSSKRQSLLKKRLRVKSA